MSYFKDLSCWGSDMHGQTLIPSSAGLGTLYPLQVSAGAAHTCAVVFGTLNMGEGGMFSWYKAGSASVVCWGGV